MNFKFDYEIVKNMVGFGFGIGHDIYFKNRHAICFALLLPFIGLYFDIIFPESKHNLGARRFL